MDLAIRERLKKFFAALALLSVELIIIWILFFGCIIVFAYTVYRIFLVKKDNLDTNVFNYLATHVSAQRN